MRLIWLHIGLPKTGTTAAQVELYHLDDERLRYARLPPGLDHNAAPRGTRTRHQEDAAPGRHQDTHDSSTFLRRSAACSYR